MIPFLKKLWMKFFFDEMAAARLMRGFLLWASGMGVSVLAYPIEVVQTWQVKDWAYRCAVAGVMGVAGMVTAGQKNRTPEEIRAALQSLPFDGVDRRGLVAPPGPTP